MKTTIALLAVLASGSAVGACKDAALLNRPDIPNGREASFEQMLEAQAAVKAYVESGEAYLTCRNPEPFVHNYVIERLERAAGAFNRERARYLQQRGAVAAN